MPTPTGTYSLVLCCRHRSAQVKITRWINKHYIIGRIKIFLGWLQLHKHVSQNFQVLTVYLCTFNRSSLSFSWYPDNNKWVEKITHSHVSWTELSSWANIYIWNRRAQSACPINGIFGRIGSWPDSDQKMARLASKVTFGKILRTKWANEIE